MFSQNYDLYMTFSAFGGMAMKPLEGISENALYPENLLTSDVRWYLRPARWLPPTHGSPSGLEMRGGGVVTFSTLTDSASGY